MFATWLRSMKKRFAAPAPRGQRPTRVRPAMEALEDRVLMATRIWDGIRNNGLISSNANWSNPQNWQGDVAPVANDTLVFPAAAFRTTGQVMDLADNIPIAGITYQGAAYSVSGTNSLALGAGGLTVNSGSQALGFPIDLAATRTVQVNSGASLKLTGVIDGVGGITKNGLGTLELAGSGDNTFTGAVKVDNGILLLNKISGFDAINGPLTVGSTALPVVGLPETNVKVILGTDNQIPDSVPVTVDRIGILDFDGEFDTIGSLTMTGGLVTTGEGRITVNGDITATSRSGPSRIEGKLSIGNPVSRVFTVNDGTSEIDLDVSAVVSGAAGSGITKEGAGRLVLSNANTYSGTTTINAGVLRASNNQALGPASTPLGTTVSAGATLEAAAAALSESLTLNGTGVGGQGALVLQGNMTKDVTLASNTTVRADGNSPLDGELLGGVSGAGALTKTGAGTLNLGSANAGYTGAITVSQGTLQAAGPNGLGSAAAGTTVQPGATLAVSGTLAEPITVGGTGVDGQGAVFASANATLTEPITLTANTTFGSTPESSAGNGGSFGGQAFFAAAILDLAGVVSGPFDVTISQGSVVAYSGASANTYGGDTTADGSLVLNKSPGVNAIPGGTLTNNGGVTVVSPNQIPDAVPIFGGLQVNAVETIGPLTLNAGDILSSNLADPATLVTLSADVTVNSGFNAVGQARLLGRVSLGNATRTITVNGGGLLTTDSNNPLEGGAAAAIVKAGAGSMFLNEVSFAGPITVNGGTLGALRGLTNPITVNTGGTFSAAGFGAFDNVTVAGGTLDPGVSFVAGLKSAFVHEIGGDLALNAASTFHVDIFGINPGPGGHDQVLLNGAGSVNLGNAKLSIAFPSGLGGGLPGFQSSVGNRYTIVQNNTANPVVGKFTDPATNTVLNNGDAFFVTTPLGRLRFLITYNDGDGNDVVITHVNTGSALQNRSITSPVVQGQVATLTGTIVEPDGGDGFFLEVNWGDGSPVETFAFPPDAPRDVALTHLYAAAPGTYSVQLNWFDDQGEGNSAALSVTVVAAPTPPPAPSPITAALINKKIGKLRKLVARVLDGDGRLRKELVSPFQKPGFTAVKVLAVDTDGDGVADAVQFLAKKGKKVVRRTVSV